MTLVTRMGFQIEFCQIALKKYNLSASSTRLISLKVTFSWCFKLKCLKQIQKCVSKDHWKFCFTSELWVFGFWNRGKLPVYIRENLLTYKKWKQGKCLRFAGTPPGLLLSLSTFASSSFKTIWAPMIVFVTIIKTLSSWFVLSLSYSL